MMRKSVMTTDSFFSGAPDLRSFFVKQFENPLSEHQNRFVWDFWHVQDQYTALRTPAYQFFPRQVYERLHNQLVWWGRNNLGCHDISPPWMSAYVHGCKQELHGDLPHGPWAFVFSLTPWSKRKFSGGETLLLKEEILTYWQSSMAKKSRESKNVGLERSEIYQEVPALFNRLTVFDPRIPHGVKEVKGTYDVCQSRLVIHGWFVQPRPFIQGKVSPRDLQNAIDALSDSLNKLIGEGLVVNGMISLRLKIRASGEVSEITTLSNSLRHPEGDERIEKALVRHIKKFLLGVVFPRKKAGSLITLPLVFE